MKNLLSSLFFLAIPAMFLGQDLSMAAYAIPDSLFSKSAHEIVREDSRYLLFKSPGEAELKRRLVVTVLDDEASSRLQYIRYDDQSKVRKASARLYDGMGHLLREVGKDEWGDESAISSGELYSDDRVRSVELVHTQFPYTIELEYELQLSQFSVFKQLLWPIQGYGQAIESASFELEVPAELSMEAHPLTFHWRRLSQPERTGSTITIRQKTCLPLPTNPWPRRRLRSSRRSCSSPAIFRSTTATPVTCGRGKASAN